MKMKAPPPTEADSKTGIWTPDLTLYNNAVADFRYSFEPELADVYSSGMVYWSRPGTLQVMCKFGGLVAFPYGAQPAVPGPTHCALNHCTGPRGRPPDV
jgi:hypothetical protein